MEDEINEREEDDESRYYSPSVNGGLFRQN